MLKKIVALLVVATAAFSLSARAAHADDIVDTAAANPQFSTLVAALKAAGLVDTLKGAGPFTVFAPTNAAFAKIPKATLNNLLKPENKAQLVAILTAHVVKGKVLAADVVKMSGEKVTTLQGTAFKIHTTKGVKIGKATVIKTDIICDNGVIHVIDTVLMPAKAHKGGKAKMSAEKPETR